MKVNAKMQRAAGGAEQIRLALASSKDFRDVLKKVLTSDLESVILTTEAEELTANPNRLFHLLGQRNALRAVLSLLEDHE